MRTLIPDHCWICLEWPFWQILFYSFLATGFSKVVDCFGCLFQWKAEGPWLLRSAKLLSKYFSRFQGLFFKSLIWNGFCLRAVDLSRVKQLAMHVLIATVIMFTLVKCIGIAFFLHSHFSDSLKVFGFLVTLLYLIGKKVILRKFSDFWWKYLFCCSWN